MRFAKSVTGDEVPHVSSSWIWF